MDMITPENNTRPESGPITCMLECGQKLKYFGTTSYNFSISGFQQHSTETAVSLLPPSIGKILEVADGCTDSLLKADNSQQAYMLEMMQACCSVERGWWTLGKHQTVKPTLITPSHS